MVKRPPAIVGLGTGDHRCFLWSFTLLHIQSQNSVKIPQFGYDFKRIFSLYTNRMINKIEWWKGCTSEWSCVIIFKVFLGTVTLLQNFNMKYFELCILHLIFLCSFFILYFCVNEYLLMFFAEIAGTKWHKESFCFASERTFEGVRASWTEDSSRSHQH